MAKSASEAATGAVGVTMAVVAAGAQGTTTGAGVWDAVEASGAAKPEKKAPRASRMDGATLPRRVWGIDALKCPRCEGPMRFIAKITDRAVIVRILTHLGLPSVEVVAAPARRWDDTS